MSNDRQSSKRKPKFSVDSVKVTPQDQASVKRVLGRLTGRVPFPVEADEQSPSPTLPNPTQPNAAQPAPIAPTRDFNKRANSLERDALPAGHFPGTSKKTYDALYYRTRGAINPTRIVRATRRELMRWAGIRSKNTIAVHIQQLEAVGWLKRHLDLGAHEGSEYEVFILEELTLPNPAQLYPTLPSPTRLLGDDPTQQLGRVGLGKAVENKSTSGILNTINKTDQITDDEAFAAFIELFQQTTVELTGKSLTPNDRLRLRELAELLTAELKIAAARTGQVSNVPAFLTEHLRRRLWKKDKAQLEREAREAPTEAAAQQGIDASKCPDCGGSGWWYPDGVERGVAKCKHQALHAK